MERRIVALVQDDEGQWIAELDCGHRRHVRHRPPFASSPWVLDADERRRRIGSVLHCNRCAQEASSMLRSQRLPPPA